MGNVTTDELIQQLVSRQDFAGIVLYPEPMPTGNRYEVKIAQASGVTPKVALHLLEHAQGIFRQQSKSADA